MKSWTPLSLPRRTGFVLLRLLLGQIFLLLQKAIDLLG